MLRETVEVRIERQDFERTRKDRAADRQIPALQATDRGARHEDARCHLSLAHAATTTSRTEPCPQGFSSPLGFRVQ